MNKITQKWLNKEQELIVEKKVHYFCACFSHWSTDADMNKAMKKLRKATRAGKYAMHVWLVPLPEETTYDIQNYAPQVKGAHLIAEVNYGR